MLSAFGGQYDDEFETVEGVFSSYAAMTTWINQKFQQLEVDGVSDVPPVIPVFNDYYFNGSFKCLGSDDVVGLKYQSFDVIGETDCKTDKIVFKEVL